MSCPSTPVAGLQQPLPVCWASWLAWPSKPAKQTLAWPYCRQQSSDVRLSEDASALLDQAAAKGQVQVAMHVVKPSPRSVWGLLSGLGPTPWSSYAVERLHPSVATELFAYLAQQLLLGKLELQHLGGLEFLIEAALQAAQPASALLMLQAAQNKQEASQPEQQQEQPQERRQRRQQVQREQLLLSDASLTKLLAVAASMGHAGVVQYLLQQGAAVLPLLLDTRRSHGMALEPWAYTRIDRSVASLLFSHLVQQYADGSLPVLSSRELEKLLREAVRYSQSDACISLLRTAVARLEQAEVAAAASAALREAALHQQPSVVIYVARHYGTSLLWPLFDVGTSTSNAVVHEVVLHVAGQVSSGAMQLDSRRLGLLVSKGAKNHDQEACAAILAAAAQQQVQLTAQDSCMTLQACIRAGCPAELVSLLLRVGDALDSSQLRSLTSRAASYNLGMVLEQLLQAGAAIDPGLVSIAIESLSSSCLAVLLRWGPLPVDTRKPVPHMYTWLGFDYRCPILQVMQRCKHLPYLDRHGLPMLELLLAAGHQPAVYQDVVLPPATQPVAFFDPLRHRPGDFASLEGISWWLWLALEPEGWCPARHYRHPLLLRRAFRTVMLAAAHGRREAAAKVTNPAQAPHKRRRLGAAEASASGTAGGPSWAACFSTLPSELLLHVLHLAARPLGAWLKTQDLR